MTERSQLLLGVKGRMAWHEVETRKRKKRAKKLRLEGMGSVATAGGDDEEDEEHEAEIWFHKMKRCSEYFEVYEPPPPDSRNDFMKEVILKKIDHGVVKIPFVAVVLNGHAFKQLVFFISERNQDGMDTFIFSIDNQLGKNRGYFGVQCVADIFLVIIFARGLYDDAIRFFFVGGRSFNAPYIGTVTGFCHGEAPQQIRAARIRQVMVVVLLSSQFLDTSAKQPKLHTELNGQTAIHEH